MSIGRCGWLRLAVFSVLVAALLLPHRALAGTATLNLVVVIDGLRPDSIRAGDTPNLARLRLQGVTFTNSHSVFPTVTRANAAAIGTGVYPARNGIFGNSTKRAPVSVIAPTAGRSSRSRYAHRASA